MASPELRDYRGRISVLADVVIDAKAKASGRERQDIVRDVLDAWATERLHAYMLLMDGLTDEGAIEPEKSVGLASVLKMVS